ncbi:uncharacterized protein [Coffea arabica]|uniref:Uncharacterized protein LOC113700026 isoform X1 n=1 Tax=Coffea arabica TaxID=13443 RepID=A0A6P6TF72_COFAR|nr:uncharacterized protein LOC113700026 isoform X1 [Coffea arabica]XP_027076246.1 uncharacterized protein LOC113700026 isoform X1 [Coffea arabica]
MPPCTRSSLKAARHKAGVLCDSVQSISGENDLKLCITNYFKGTSGKYSQKSGQAPLYTDDECEQENKMAKLQKGKRAILLDSTDDHVEVVAPKRGKAMNKGKLKRPKRTRKFGNSSPGEVNTQSFEIDSISSHFSERKESSMSPSIGIPSPPAPTDDMYHFWTALQALGAYLAAAEGDLLEDETEDVFVLCYCAMLLYYVWILDVKRCGPGPR